MTATRPEIRSGLLRQLSRFVGVGAFAAVVDYGMYQSLIHLGGLDYTPAKAVSFACGTLTAYLLNRRFTFGAAAAGPARFTGFVLLYGTTFFVNVGVNFAALMLIPELPARVTLCWLIAQGTATAINFLVLRTLIFRR